MVKILIVDDSVFMRTVIRDMVTKDPSIEVVGTASNGLDALEKIQSLEPDLVTLDIEMPKMSGIQVLEELRKFKRRPKILMVSSLTSKDAEMTHPGNPAGCRRLYAQAQGYPPCAGDWG